MRDIMGHFTFTQLERNIFGKIFYLFDIRGKDYYDVKSFNIEKTKYYTPDIFRTIKCTQKNHYNFNVIIGIKDFDISYRGAEFEIHNIPYSLFYIDVL